MPLSLIFTVFFLVCFACMYLGFGNGAAPPREAARMLALVQTEREDRRRISLREQLTARILSAATALRKAMRLTENEKIRKRLQQAGVPGAGAADTFFGAQAVGILLGGIGGSLLPETTLFWIFTGAVVGYMAPDVWLTAQGKKRRDRMRRSVPDTVDLLVICVEAGLGLDQALIRVREALSVSHPDLNDELERLNYELLAGTPRIEAWRRLAERTKIEEIAALANILSETDRFGTPIVKALGGYSEELRLKRRQHAEEAAAKTKIKIIFPLVLCIFPCIFIVLLAPALLNIASGMKSMGN